MSAICQGFCFSILRNLAHIFPPFAFAWDSIKDQWKKLPLSDRKIYMKEVPLTKLPFTTWPLVQVIIFVRVPRVYVALLRI